MLPLDFEAIACQGGFGRPFHHRSIEGKNRMANTILFEL